MRLRTVLLIASAMALGMPAQAGALPRPALDAFYVYDGQTPLADVAPGTVLKTRSVPYHLAGVRSRIQAVQILYRSTGMIGQPTTNVTSILKPPHRRGHRHVIAYGSFYDSLNRNDQPSYAIAGGVTFGGLINTAEAVFIAPFLNRGYTVAVADIQGQGANFAAGPEYGYNTLDGLRAAFAAPATGLSATSKAGLFGYSGGAIATEWAAELAPEYAPDVDARLVGAAMGGVLAKPSTNLHYVNGSRIWAGIMPMAIIGAARSFQVDLRQYLSPYGERLYERMRDDSIAEVIGAYPGLTWQRLAKSQYRAPEAIPIYVEKVNRLIMSTYGTPTVPLFIGQGARGELEGTKGNRAGVGTGDGVMVAGDVRALAREFCRRGVTVEYREYPGASHITSIPIWAPSATGWLLRRFTDRPAGSTCGAIKPGNSLAPVELIRDE